MFCPQDLDQGRAFIPKMPALSAGLFDATADQPCTLNATDQGVAQQAGADTMPHGAGRFRISTMGATGVAGADSTAMNSANPSWLMRTSLASISASSAARTAASRMKSVRDRPRNWAARSMMARTADGLCDWRWPA